MTIDNYRGFSLFNDIEDAELRNRNRAVILTNMYEDCMDKKTKRVSAKGAALICNYFLQIPIDERVDVQDRFKMGMKQRGFLLEA